MKRTLRTLCPIVITGVILFGLVAPYSLTMDQYFWVIQTGIATILLILITRHICFSVKPIELLLPISGADTVVVLLILLQVIYCYWEAYTYWSETHLLRFSIPHAIICMAIVLVVLGYIRGKRWAWAMAFLLSVYVLHEAIYLKNDWQYLDPDPSIPKWVALLELFVCPLCLRFLGSTTDTHLINRREFAKVLGALALTTCLIFIRGNYFAPGSSEYARPLSEWEFIVGEAYLWNWMILALLWGSYVALAILDRFWKRNREVGELIPT